ncbi:hypothetical protein BSKO_05361 [Bryopsis sp. KO-2023]|nr:hypothetical protein BSKO_05361 [Bryopsis sp. KO-2023]
MATISCSTFHRPCVTSPSFQRGFLGRSRVSKGARAPATNRRTAFKVMAAAEKTVLVPVGNGSEEMEAVIIVDVLRRAGAQVTVASVEPDLTVTCSRGIMLEADACITECANEEYDLIALPGGMPGAERLRDNRELHELLSAQCSSDRLCAAICASPAVVLEPKGFLKGKKATSHPAFVEKLSDQSSADDRVVVDGKLTTSRGPGTAFEFALTLVEHLYGKEAMESVAGPMVMYNHQ